MRATASRAACGDRATQVRVSVRRRRRRYRRASLGARPTTARSPARASSSCRTISPLASSRRSRTPTACSCGRWRRASGNGRSRARRSTSSCCATSRSSRTSAPDEHLRLRDRIRAGARGGAPARPWVGVPLDVYDLEHMSEFNPLPDSRGRARAAAERSIEIDPTCQFGWRQIASAPRRDRDLHGLRMAAERTIQLNPLSTSAPFVAMLLAYAGDWDRGMPLVRRAMDLNRQHAGWYHFPVFVDHFRQGRVRDALTHAKALERAALPVDACWRSPSRPDSSDEPATRSAAVDATPAQSPGVSRPGEGAATWGVLGVGRRTSSIVSSRGSRRRSRWPAPAADATAAGRRRSRDPERRRHRRRRPADRDSRHREPRPLDRRRAVLGPGRRCRDGEPSPAA